MSWRDLYKPWSEYEDNGATFATDLKNIMMGATVTVAKRRELQQFAVIPQRWKDQHKLADGCIAIRCAVVEKILNRLLKVPAPSLK